MDNATTIIVAVLASSGVWAVVNSITAYFIERRKQKDNSQNITKDEFDAVVKGLRGLLYGELEQRCSHFIQQGKISAGELNDLRKYYFEPYKSLQGDGTIDKLMQRVENLEITD